MIGVIVALGLAVALAHGAPGQDHMAGMGGMDDSRVSQSAVVSACLAVLEVGSTGAVLLGGWFLFRRQRATDPSELQPSLVSLAAERTPSLPRARAGPALLQVYRL